MTVELNQTKPHQTEISLLIYILVSVPDVSQSRFYTYMGAREISATHVGQGNFPMLASIISPKSEDY